MVKDACLIAGFEAGIKLGALFHQFVGMPVSESNAELVERVVESCVRLQPFVESVRIKIDRKKLKEKASSFGYTTLVPEMMQAEVVVSFEGCRVKAELRWVEELNYPLMEVTEVDVI